MRQWTFAIMMLGLAQGAIAQPQSAAGPPVKVKLSREVLAIDDAGGAKRTRHAEFVILNAAGVAASQVPLPYNALTELTVTGAYTLKPDGRRIAVPESGIMTRPFPVAGGGANFNDFMQKVVVFPDVEVGDTLVLDHEESQKGLFAGHQMDAKFFSTALQQDEVSYTVSAPQTVFLQVEAIGGDVTKKTEGGRTTYVAQFRNPVFVRDTNPLLSPWDRMPRLFVSTFRSYDEMVRAYAVMVAPKLAVTPKVQALADQLTQGVTDRREQARRIYNHVSTRIRYVAVSFGTGAIVPHDAETVMANGYGDCKDKAVLLSALLKAKGIASELVIINGTNGYTLSGPPTLAQLNHVIAWLPEFQLYADATAQVAPFGVLPLEEYAKPVLHVTAQGLVRRTIPPAAPEALSITATTDATMAESGTITGTTVVKATGPLDVRLRRTALMLQATGGQQTPYQAIHPVFHFDKPDDLDKAFSVRGEFSVDANPRLLMGQGFAPPTGTWLVTRPGGLLMGPVTQNNMTERDDTPCYSGRAEETINLTIPNGRRVAALPTDNVIQNEYAQYRTHWSMSGQTVTVHRSFSSRMDQPFCRGPVRKSAMTLLEKIRQDYSVQVSLAPI